MDLSLWLCVTVIWTLFSELTAQTYDSRWKGHTTFPTDIPANTIKINVAGNSINSFPYNAFDNFYQLEILYIGNNPFTNLPNLAPIGGTLKFLQMYNCKLTELNASIFNELVVLEEINVQHCPLTSFPDVGGPGNTLWKIACSYCKLRTFPLLSNYKALKYISFRRNPMTSVPEAAVASAHMSGRLSLLETAITSLPQYPKGYENLTFINLLNTTVSFFLVPLNYCSKLYKSYHDIILDNKYAMESLSISFQCSPLYIYLETCFGRIFPHSSEAISAHSIKTINQYNAAKLVIIFVSSILSTLPFV